MDYMNKKDLCNAELSDEELACVNGGAALNYVEIGYQQELQDYLEKQWMEEADKIREADDQAKDRQRMNLCNKRLAKQ